MRLGNLRSSGVHTIVRYYSIEFYLWEVNTMFGNDLSKVEKLVAKKKDGELAKLTGSKDEAVRLAAIAGLGKVGGEDGYNALVTLLRSPEPQIRIAVANAMAELADPKLRAHIEHLAKNETDPKVSAALLAALAKIKEKI
jgi:HEAT repeat protein